MQLHLDILSKEQHELLPFVGRFRSTHYLVGGTALALQIGHRHSIDFDLFSVDPVQNQSIIGGLVRRGQLDSVRTSSSKELTLLAKGVQMTWFQYDFEVPTSVEQKYFRLPDVVTLGAMKLYAIGHRAKWKDYVDMYFILREHTLQEVILRATELFSTAFSERLARTQLTYFQDINYTESVSFMPGFEVDDAVVKAELTGMAIE